MPNPVLHSVAAPTGASADSPCLALHKLGDARALEMPVGAIDIPSARIVVHPVCCPAGPRLLGHSPRVDFCLSRAVLRVEPRCSKVDNRQCSRSADRGMRHPNCATAAGNAAGRARCTMRIAACWTAVEHTPCPSWMPCLLRSLCLLLRQLAKFATEMPCCCPLCPLSLTQPPSSRR
jgi:hypothetical protein